MRCDFNSYKTYNPIIPLGFIRGPKNNDCCHLNFWKGFEKGSLLSTNWQNGKIGFYPFYYQNEKEEF